MERKILILGASGFLGSVAYSFFRNKSYECVGTSFRNDQNSLIQTDLTEEGELEKVLNQTNPEIVMNCTNLGGFQSKNPEQIKRVNFGINESLSQNFNGKIVTFSTDYVFDGKKGDYTELDEPNPLNIYGRTRLLGENVLMNSGKDVLILRTALVYGGKIKSYVKFVHDNLKGGKEIDAWPDVITTPTHIEDICNSLNNLLNENARGIYHVAGSEKLSRYEFAVRIAKYFGFDTNLINDPNYSGEVKVPRDASLRSIKLPNKLRKAELSFT